MNIIGKRKTYLFVSGLLVVLSIISLLINGLKLSIDFTGGSRLEIASNSGEKIIKESEIDKAYASQNIKISSIQDTDEGYRISSSEISKEKKKEILNELDARELGFEVLGPTIGSETRDKAITAVFFAIIAITIYIAIAFFRSGGVISSWKLGASAIIALVHDVVITLGFFSLFGLLFDVQVDALFVTAILTIMGFSVHDTIVVFDRIRENIANNVKRFSFEELVNNSINETIGRSLNTSVTVLFVLFAMALFGGESIRWFVIAFIIGVIAGTYSSIFVASPILVIWHNWDRKKIKTLKR